MILNEVDISKIKNSLKKASINIKGSLLTLLFARTALELETIQRAITIIRTVAESKGNKMKTYKELTAELTEGTDLESYKSTYKKEKNRNILLTEFSGGEEDGRMLQLNVGMKNVQLTKADAAKVSKSLAKWAKGK